MGTEKPLTLRKPTAPPTRLRFSIRPYTRLPAPTALTPTATEPEPRKRYQFDTRLAPVTSSPLRLGQGSRVRDTALALTEKRTPTAPVLSLVGRGAKGPNSTPLPTSSLTVSGTSSVPQPPRISTPLRLVPTSTSVPDPVTRTDTRTPTASSPPTETEPRTLPRAERRQLKLVNSGLSAGGRVRVGEQQALPTKERIGDYEYTSSVPDSLARGRTGKTLDQLPRQIIPRHEFVPLPAPTIIRFSDL